MKHARIKERFLEIGAQNKTALIPFITAGFPDYTTCAEILNILPQAGADLIEIGMPFSDPIADGLAIQAAGLHSINSGQTMDKTFRLIEGFRMTDQKTPLILMGYYNPIHHYGVTRFLEMAIRSNVDGLIIVDLPPEEDDELCKPARQAGLDFIRLMTPTTNAKRALSILPQASGFIYYISILGVTGTKTPDPSQIKKQIDMIRSHSDLPIAVGFGIKTPQQAHTFKGLCDGVVVGSAVIETIYKSLTADHQSTMATVPAVHDFINSLARSLR